MRVRFCAKRTLPSFGEARTGEIDLTLLVIFFTHASTFQLLPGQAVVTGVVPSPRLFLLSIFIALRGQLSHCSSIAHRMHSLGGIRTHETDHDTRLEDNLIRHRGDRVLYLLYCTRYSAVRKPGRYYTPVSIVVTMFTTQSVIRPSGIRVKPDHRVIFLSTILL